MKLFATILDRLRPHRHEYVPIDAQPLRYVPEEVMTRPSQTILLLRCKSCGSYDVRVFMGSWTIEQFSRNESEIAELERMAK
jgi:hypothetical protein